MTAPTPRRGPLAEAPRTVRKLQINLDRNRAQDHTQALDAAAAAFDWSRDEGRWWNAPEQSLLYGTPIWDAADDTQRRRLNQLYWVAYYAQVVSAEVATIYFNQTSAAALYGLDDFRLVCDTLDLETSQERAHIAAFQHIGETVERSLLGERLFTWPMRGPFAPTMIFSDLGPFRERLRRLQLMAFGLLSSTSAFLGSQYFTVRGLRTLNGKMVQHKLSRFCTKAYPDTAEAPVPSLVSHLHFLDESFHFNSSTLIGVEVLETLPPPTRLERTLADATVRGCQKDHARVSITLQGLFWDDVQTWPAVLRLLTSPVFGLSRDEALARMQATWCEENEALHQAHALHATARASYRRYVERVPYLSATNHEMAIMGRTTLPTTLARHRRAFARFAQRARQEAA